MTSTALPRQSLTTRVTLTTLTIFLVSLWSLSYYASQMLHKDMENLLGEQQFSTVSFVAAEINHELDDRLGALHKVAATISPFLLGNPAALQTFLEERPILQGLFNGGVIAYRLDGTAMADSLVTAGRIGVNYMDRDFIVGALKEGKSTIGAPVMGKKLRAPVFGMAVPIRDAQGKVIGALAGVTTLGKPNFLDTITDNRYGKTGGYMVIDPQHRLVVTATDKRRIMETYPVPGSIPLLERFFQGDEGYGVAINPLGVEVLASAKGIPVAGWFLAALLPTAEAFAPFHAMQRRMLLATILLTLLASVLTWWLLRRQLAPLLAAARTLATMSETNQPPQPLPITRQDEIGQLIGGFNRLLITLAQREEALRETEAFKNVILNSVAAEIAVLDRNGVIRMVNEPWRRFALENSIKPSKPAPQAGVGSNYLAACKVGTDFTSHEAMDASNGIQAVLDGRLPSFSLEYPCHSPEQQRWFTMSVLPLGRDTRNGVAITHTNITALKQAQKELRIAAIAFECQEGILILDANKKILRVNQAFVQLTGYSQQEVEGTTTGFLRSDRHPATLYENVWREVTRTGAWQGEFWHRRKNGDDYFAQSAMTAVQDEKEQVTHFVCSFTDITASHLQEQQRRLKEAAHRNTLVQEVHHRIKNNLQGITGLLRQFAQKHPETADPINQAIGQVQGISVIHGLQGRAVSSSVRLCELTSAIADEIQNLWQTRVTVDIPPLWAHCVIAEKEAVPIALILNELVLNAVKHGGKAHGNVSITLGKGSQPDVVQITIVNVGQLSIDGGQTGSHHSGLALISALMPYDGASVVRKQHGDRVITLLALQPPVISMDQVEAS